MVSFNQNLFCHNSNYIQFEMSCSWIHNYWSLQPISWDYWSSFSNRLMLILILYISGGTYSLKSIPNDWFFWEIFHGSFNFFQTFCQKSDERKSQKKYFLYFVLMSGLGLEPYLLDYSNIKLIMKRKEKRNVYI